MNSPVEHLARRLPTVLAWALFFRYAHVWLEMARLPRRLADEQRRFSQAATAARGDALDLLVVVPALSEYATLGRTLPTLLEAAGAETRAQVQVVVVTTERERSERRRLRAVLADPTLTGATAGRSADQLGGNDEELIAALRRATADGAPAEELRSLVDAWPYTWELAEEFPSTTWLHSPRTDGRMASQLNFAVERVGLVVPAGWKTASTYVCVYNADTVPQPDSFTCLVDTLLAHDRPPAAQLMCAPMLNFGDLASASGVTSAYLAGAAIYQSRWALGREFRMYRVAVRRRRPSYYCRGHGMTLRLDTLLRHGGFEERTALEDLFCGHLLSLERSHCPAVPVVERTASPATLADLTRQKAYWFSGMLDLVHYGSWVADRGLRYRHAGQWARLFAAGLLRDVLPWLLGPPAALGVVVCASRQWRPWLLLPVLNAVCSTVLVLHALPGEVEGWPPSRGRSRAAVRLALGTLAYASTRNAGPLRASIARAACRPVRR
ncbi:MAG: hypothetical protein M3357_05965 [Actinomycetota bacterium]|nr:hypothetical protein [Actinomycetota bacterium]